MRNNFEFIFIFIISILFLPINVFASDCESGWTYSYQYLNSSSNWVTLSGSSLTGIPTQFRVNIKNTSSTSGNYSFSGHVVYQVRKNTAPLYVPTDVIFYDVAVSSTDISSLCRWDVNTTYDRADGLIYQGNFDIQYYCNFTSSNSPVQLRLLIYTGAQSYTNNTPFYIIQNVYCVIKNPSDADNIINNADSNTSSIISNFNNQMRDLQSLIDQNNSRIHSDLNDLKDSQDQTNSLLSGLGNFFSGSDTTNTDSSIGSLANITIGSDYGNLSSLFGYSFTLLNNLKEDHCTGLDLELFNKHITLPCGTDLFWNKDFNSSPSAITIGYNNTQKNAVLGGFRQSWNLIVGMPLVIYLLFKLFKTIEHVCDPSNTDVNTLDDVITDYHDHDLFSNKGSDSK